MVRGKQKTLDAHSTAYILGMFRAAVKRELMYSDGYNTDRTVYFDGYYFTRNELKEYLATRPHVMNKKESREARIARKKSGQKRKPA